MNKKIKKPKSETPVITGNAVDLIGLFEADDRVIKLTADGYVSISRPGKVPIDIWVDQDGNIVITGDDAITIQPRAANAIRIIG